MGLIYKQIDDKAKLTENSFDNSDIYAGQKEIFIIPSNYGSTTTARRSRLCARILCLTTCACFVCFLMFGSFLLFNFFTTPRTWYNTCSVRYRAPETRFLIDKGGLNANDLADKPIFKPVEVADDEVEDGDSGEFKQVMSLNSTDQTERIEVPNIDNYKKAVFIHDFVMNWSVIYDLIANRCFIMPLDRSKISPPKDILDILIKTKQGYYLPDNMLLHQYMVVQKQITDLQPFGPSIESRCKKASSYLMEKRHLIGENHNVDKRDAIEKRCEYASDFIHSTGVITLVDHIVC